MSLYVLNLWKSRCVPAAERPLERGVRFAMDCGSVPFRSVPFGSARLDSVVWFDSISFFHGHQRSINEARDDQTGPARLLRHTGILPFGCCVGGLSADATLCVSLVRKHQSNIAMAASAFASPNNRPPRASAYSLHSLRTAPQVVAVPLSVVDHLTVDAYDAVRKRKNH